MAREPAPGYIETKGSDFKGYDIVSNVSDIEAR